MSIFSKIEKTKVKSNTFDLSHDKKLSCNMGMLIPTLALECVPGDKFVLQTSQLVRFAPMLAPMMHQVSVYTHFYFVPNRLLWPNWEKFITGGEDGEDTSVFPTILFNTETAVTQQSLADYLGLPLNNTNGVKVSALPFAAYTKIWNEYYRDQNLQDKLIDTLVDGDNSAEYLYTIASQLPLRRAWQHDYFTSALPWTQKGPEVLIPLGDEAPLVYYPETPNVIRDDTGSQLVRDPLNLKTDANGVPYSVPDSTMALWDVSGTHYADLSEATQTTIIELRRAFKLQEWLEKNARGGSRYIESIMSHFGVRSSDQRLQRPEYLGGSSTPVSVSEVLQTSDAAAGDTPQGNMAGHGISVGGNSPIRYYAEEHGYIIGIMSIMPKSAYYQGVPKHFLKFDRFDYYWPTFAHIGEQAILNQELYVDSTEQNGVFGYTPRYAEYKYIPSSVHGAFRTSLDFWHMGRKFSSQPVLNEDFIKCYPTDRIFAVSQSEQLYVHVYNGIQATRKMPYFGTPYM